MFEAIKKILISCYTRLQIWYGSRCPCGGLMIDQFENTGWPEFVCEACGRKTKY